MLANSCVWCHVDADVGEDGISSRRGCMTLKKENIQPCIYLLYQLLDDFSLLLAM